MQADGHGRCTVHRIDIKIVIDMEHAATQSRIDLSPTIDDAIHVCAFQRGEPGIETFRRHTDAMDGDIAGQQPLQAMFQSRHRGNLHMPDGALQDILTDVDMADLMAGVHARIGTPRHHQAQRLVGIVGGDAQNAAQRALHFPLHRANVGLHGPSVERPTVICQIDPKSHNHP